MTENNKIIATDQEAIGILPVPDSSVSPITVIGTEAIQSGFDSKCLQQAINSRLAPGVTELVLNPDGHAGYGAPVGCVMVSASHIYPGPVGVDIKCSMSLIQLDLPKSELESKTARRAVIDALLQRLPTGPGKGQRSVKKSRHVDLEIGRELLVNGASEKACAALGIPSTWTKHCEDSFHSGHDGSQDALGARLELIERKMGSDVLHAKLMQAGSYGGGNHFGEANVVSVVPGEEQTAEHFGLRDGCIAFLSHCGSRGFGYALANQQFRALQQHFATWDIPLPGNDRELVYAPLGTKEANEYIDDMSLGANFATLNHLLINALVAESFAEVFPGLQSNFVYFISHNIAREEIVNNKRVWVHRKGATRAFPAGHPALKGGYYEKFGHPILLPGNPAAGSAIMVADPGAARSCYSVNHGAGRAMSRTQATKQLNQGAIDAQFDQLDILSNCRKYPIDEAPAAYKDFNEVLRSVEQAKLAHSVAKLSARFVIKDSDQNNRGQA